MNLETIVASNVKRLMINNHVTQNDLGDYLDLSRQTVAKYLKGNGTFDTVQLVKLAHFFRVPIEQILAGTDEAEVKICYRATENQSNFYSYGEELLRTYIKKFNSIAQAVGYYSVFIPEQYDLFATIRGEKINVNRELGRVIKQPEKIDEVIEKDILSIADEQRANLSLQQDGAISIIPALEKKGIKVVFLDFDCNNVSGASVCSESCGCFIFVNSNPNITIERQVFTVAHEYGHILLHRPQYYNEYVEINNKFYEDYLNHMANKFAARLVSPPSLYYQYALELNQSANDLGKILPLALNIKHRVQLSLQSVMLSLRDNGYISHEVVEDFYNLLDTSNARRTEPFPISENNEVWNSFLQRKNANVQELVERAYILKQINIDDFAFLLGVNHEIAEKIVSGIEEKHNKMLDFTKINHQSPCTDS